MIEGFLELSRLKNFGRRFLRFFGSVLFGDDVIADTGAALEDLYRQLPEDVSQQEVLTFLEGYPTRYLRVVDQLDVFEHVRLSRNLKPAELHATIRKTDASWELSAIALDQPGLFANICGVLSYFGMDILRGQAMNNDHGVVLDLFQFADHEGYLRLNTGAKKEIRTAKRKIRKNMKNLPTISLADPSIRSG